MGKIRVVPTKKTECELCGRGPVKLTKHHLIPKSKHRKKRVAREYGPSECKTRIGRFCGACHGQVHRLHSNGKLERDLNTIAKLQADPEVAKYLEWIRSKPVSFVPKKKKKRRRV